MNGEEKLFVESKEFLRISQNASKAANSLCRFTAYLTYFSLLLLGIFSIAQYFVDIDKEYYWVLFIFLAIVLLVQRFITHLLDGLMDRCKEAGESLIKEIHFR